MFAAFLLLLLLHPTSSFPLHPDYSHSPFLHGVASGDPTSRSVLLWTRSNSSSALTWSIWNTTFSFNGSASVFPTDDYTVTVTVPDVLEPRTRYEYQFVHVESGNVSARGRTKTAPALGDERPVVMATVSCSSTWSGWMNSYGRIEERDEVDVVAHVGDFIYPEIDRWACRRVPQGLDSCRKQCEGQPVLDGFVREHVEKQDCGASALERFRWMHQYNLLDPALRLIRQRHPFITMFDNHDLDSSRSTNVSKSGELRAFIEYIPMRVRVSSVDNSTALFFRNFTYGSMAEIIALDTRALGYVPGGDQTYLGGEQQAFVSNALENSKNQHWRVVLTTTSFVPWAVNGWEAYINGIMAGTLVAFVLMLLACTGAWYWVIRKQKTLPVLEKSEQKTLVVLHPFQRQRRVLLCCAVYGCINVIIVIAVWIGLFVVVRKTLAARNINLGTESIQLIAAQSRNWDGHPADRRDFLQRMRNANATRDNVWISGDLHMSLGADVRDVDVADVNTLYTGERFGVEILSSSVTRSNVDEVLNQYLPSGFVEVAVLLAHTVMYRANPHFRYFQATEHGYGLLTFGITNVTAEFWHTPVVVDSNVQWLARKLICMKGSNAWV